MTAPTRAPTLAALLVLASPDLADAVKREAGSEVPRIERDESTCAAPATVSDSNASCKSSMTRFASEASRFSSREAHCKKRVDVTVPKSWRLTARIGNLFDKDHELAHSSHAPRRAVHVAPCRA